MKERAKKALAKLQQQNVELKRSFDAYVNKLVDELEIPKDIAVTLVRDELVNKYEKELILKDLFSKHTLKDNGF